MPDVDEFLFDLVAKKLTQSKPRPDAIAWILRLFGFEYGWISGLTQSEYEYLCALQGRLFR